MSTSRFLPTDEIARIISHENLQIHHMELCDVFASILSCRRKLFAILALMGRPYMIVKLICEGIVDDDLPFDQDQESRTLRCRDKKRTVESLVITKDQWHLEDFNSFFTTQWQFLAPRFGMGCPCVVPAKVEFGHKNFRSMFVLPFTKSSAVTDSDFESICNSIVRKVHIHPAHMTRCPRIIGAEVPYAAKIIDAGGLATLARSEIEHLRRFDGEENGKRLVQLLFSFEYQARFCLIFQWADGNLMQFWQHDGSQPRGYSLARWVAREMLGLAQGLDLIHNSPPRKQGDLSTKGRHGDIKPENILWFNSDGKDGNDYDYDGDGDGDGRHHQLPTQVLKFCDFGLADFHTQASVSKVPSQSIGMTQSYRAPECETHPNITQAYDLWSLGCVLLQFVTWYMQGWDGVDAFSISRMGGSLHEVLGWHVSEDTFFHLITQDFKKKPIDHPAVKKASSTHPLPSCPVLLALIGLAAPVNTFL
ncbi:kinase-like domain-containing protein [Lasiosphaeria miniovina]|uniref:Kinase-like domain-containing protein n=1 Tax=Lasiosphaeria miniovina TaxID=1954250 RepID=A0AA40A0H5_9PEZI|nr:kinase-like domain-containing protein [Lasiosphaeria miniovina]KAK0707056.1 kinase-like domain-containing protein [Lasiosphaeria miniovina]